MNPEPPEAYEPWNLLEKDSPMFETDLSILHAKGEILKYPILAPEGRLWAFAGQGSLHHRISSLPWEA